MENKKNEIMIMYTIKNRNLSKLRLFGNNFVNNNKNNIIIIMNDKEIEFNDYYNLTQEPKKKRIIIKLIEKKNY